MEIVTIDYVVFLDMGSLVYGTYVYVLGLSEDTLQVGGCMDGMAGWADGSLSFCWLLGLGDNRKRARSAQRRVGPKA